MEASYKSEYRKAFAARIRYARMVHRTFGKPLLNDLSFYVLRLLPFLIDYTQAKIHGREFWFCRKPHHIHGLQQSYRADDKIANGSA